MLQWDYDAISRVSPIIAEHIELDNLFVCTDGAYQQETKQGSHAWVFSSSTHILWQGSGPSPGHPNAMSPYRAELCGLTSCLYILHWVCTNESVNCGKVTIYCDNATALRELFTKPPKTNNPYRMLKPDIDLLAYARVLLQNITDRIDVKKEWVKGHYSGPNRKQKHNLNNVADALAGMQNSMRHPSNKYTTIMPPLYEAELIHNDHIVTSKLQHLVTSSIHLIPLQQYITKSAS